MFCWCPPLLSTYYVMTRSSICSNVLASKEIESLLGQKETTSKLTKTGRVLNTNMIMTTHHERQTGD